MKFDRNSLLLYAVTDRSRLINKSLPEYIREAAEGGITLLQLREKDLPHDEFLAEAKEIKALCTELNLPLIINDDVDIAIACGAHGVHVGQSDMEAGAVRDRVGPDMIVGVSAQTVEQALLAEKHGADYLGVGAVFSTSTKADADDVSLDTLRDICSAVSIPVVAIGGIGEDNIARLQGTGIDGVSVVSAIFAQEDPRAAASKLRALCEKYFREEAK